MSIVAATETMEGAIKKTSMLVTNLLLTKKYKYIYTYMLL